MKKTIKKFLFGVFNGICILWLFAGATLIIVTAVLSLPESGEPFLWNWSLTAIIIYILFTSGMYEVLNDKRIFN